MVNKQRKNQVVGRAPRPVVATILLTGLGALLIYLLVRWLGSSSVDVIEPVKPYAPDVPVIEFSITGVDVADELVDTVYLLESTRGKFDPCRREGKFNGFGYNPGKCYESHEQVRGLVKDWFTKRLSNGFTIAQAACYYNQGKVDGEFLSDCEYYQKLLASL